MVNEDKNDIVTLYKKIKRVKKCVKKSVKK